MLIVAASDLHGSSVALSKVSGTARDIGADVILLAGDITVHHIYNEFILLLHKAAAHAKCPVIFTLGNHDTLQPEKYFPESIEYINGTKPLTRKSVVCLVEQSIEYKGVKFWGSPYTNTFGKWYWMRNPAEMKFEIPEDTDVAICHSPPFGYGDSVRDATRVGSEALTLAIQNTPNLELVVFGHVHENGGWRGQLGNTHLCNVSMTKDQNDFGINYEALLCAKLD